MIRRRLNHIEFALRLSVLLLPLAAFGIAAYVRFDIGLKPVMKVWTPPPILDCCC